jgi:Do/DeqQ family serine protease
MKPIRDWLLQKSSTGTVVLLSVALGASLAGRWDRPEPVGAADHAVSQAEQHAVLSTIQDAFTSLADRVEPTVVSIEAIHTVSPAANEEEGTPSPNPFGDSPFAPFFRQFGTPGQPRAQRAGGSGIIVRERGNELYVLTNNHVVNGANRLTIKLQSGESYTARLVGTDPHSDLAVLRFDAGHSLGERYVAQLGDSDQVRVGQWAIAIGSPLGYDTTLTTGVISAKGRELDGVEGSNSYRGLIQTDASINPGNSGGPLVNIDGQVVGINVAIASPTGSSIGIGFAIPVNRAKRVMEELIANGKVTRGYLGIATSPANQELSDELKSYYGVKDGALVESVTAGTPAEKAGLKSEDVIVAFDSHPVHNFGDLEDAVAATPPGRQVRVDIIRAHLPQSVNLTLAERPADSELANRFGRRQPRNEAAPATPNAFGFSVAPGPDGGVVVAQITPGSAAEDAGLAPGDTILSTAGAPVRDLSSWQHALAGAGSNALVLKVRRASTGLTSILVLKKS